MAIERLSLQGTITASTVFAINVNGQDYRATAGALVTYLQSALGGGEFTTQYAVPAATGFSVQVNDSDDNTWLIINPLGAYAAGTIVLPAVANCVDGQELIFNCTQAVTTLTIDGNGAVDVLGEPTTLAANAYFRLRFQGASKVWYRVG